MHQAILPEWRVDVVPPRLGRVVPRGVKRTMRNDPLRPTITANNPGPDRRQNTLSEEYWGLAVEAGDLVAADARLCEAASLTCIESALTGEPQAEVKKPTTMEKTDVPLDDCENMVFMGTSVAAGTGQAVVVATATRTELGRIAELM